MAVYDVGREGGRTVIRKRHPILDFFLIAFAVCLVVGSILRDWWLLIPTIAVAVLAVQALRAKARAHPASCLPVWRTRLAAWWISARR